VWFCGGGGGGGVFFGGGSVGVVILDQFGFPRHLSGKVQELNPKNAFEAQSFPEGGHP